MKDKNNNKCDLPTAITLIMFGIAIGLIVGVEVVSRLF